MHVAWDITAGDHTDMGGAPDTLPVQKEYPSSVNGNWGVKEGDQFEYSLQNNWY